MTKAQLRNDFERCAVKNGYVIQKVNGEYRNLFTAIYWNIWQNQFGDQVVA